ncbi:MAG: bifunctional phosphopantothenoylcysteine decarboxylase/phosphopantothenate--cysteine ligase CoaBC [Ectothiorhodospiraceae bacterium]|jgi:phosphopantothenoylcysteine decarboxylase/phosphopantothenate--cysteine ligase|nr:bifunctional phosphopantothenoylcysteine decarboxylase/phosphopantothenate--cysteine ligase CoaBC [Ectothiorhodospiraceae bacterium]
MYLQGKHILLGVTGGIAAYKACELTRRLRDAGAIVRVVMTRAALEFVTPLSFQALSGHPVRTDLFDEQAEAGMGHIELARWADAVLVAPCSADFMARLAAGRADDLLSTLCLASDAPLAIAPAMNRQMWANAATQANRDALGARGVSIFGPASGEQACGETGEGRMLEAAELVERLSALFATGALAGRTVLISAGPTREALDPVRYLSNRSSGRMGYALAEAAREAGARVLLVSGPVALATPRGVERIEVESAAQMFDAVMARIDEVDLFIGAAAVADYRPVELAAQKIKKTAATLTLELERTPDILAAVAAREPRPFVVGFAAETQDVEAHARDKLSRKRLDMIAANDVSAGRGFDVEDNALEVFWADGHASLPQQSKARLARELVALIAGRMSGA